MHSDDALTNPGPSTSKESSPDDEESSVQTDQTRKLRKRRLNLNQLSDGITCDSVCEFANCGMKLKNGRALEWHYEGHYAQELDKLDKLRVKKHPANQDELLRRRVRDSAVDRIKFNREKRLASKSSSTAPASTSSSLPRCPVCDLEVDDVDYVEHLEVCLKTHHPENPSDIDEEDELDVDDIDGYETYTWAGHTRVRATSLVEGGLRGPAS